MTETHWMTLASFALGFAVAWGALTTRVRGLERDLADVDRRLDNDISGRRAVIEVREDIAAIKQMLADLPCHRGDCTHDR